MKTLALIATLAALASPAMAQGYTVQTMPLGGGWQHYNGTTPDGGTFQGTEMPMGGGWTHTRWNDSNGNTTTCTTMPMGGGFATTRCQ